jgi:(p)ppGpp synthase/HD superfamily hydrolase
MKTPKTTRSELLSKLSSLGLGSDSLVAKALEQAFLSHSAQQRDDGASYLEQHVYAVTASIIEYCEKMQRVATPELIAGVLLHDALEDDDALTDDQFRQQFGNRVYEIVKPLSKPDYRKYPGRTKEDKKYALDRDYFVGLECAPEESRIIKLADRLNNISCIHLSPKRGKMDFYIKETEEFYLPFAKKVSEYYYSMIKGRVDMLKTSGSVDFCAT